MQDTAAVLLVEDRADDILLVLQAFQKAGIVNPLRVVKSGEEAVQYLAGLGGYVDHPPPQLVLLDLKLPGMDGFEVLSWIRQQSPIRKVPVLVLTSSDHIQDVNRAYSLGANSFLVKPLDFQNYGELGKILRAYWLQTVKTPETFWPQAGTGGPAASAS